MADVAVDKEGSLNAFFFTASWVRAGPNGLAVNPVPVIVDDKLKKEVITIPMMIR
jgi:hypothetical protein